MRSLTMSLDMWCTDRDRDREMLSGWSCSTGWDQGAGDIGSGDSRPAGDDGINGREWLRGEDATDPEMVDDVNPAAPAPITIMS